MRMLGAPMRSYEIEEAKDQNFVGLAISPDEKIIATGYPHGQLRLWRNPLAGDWPSVACAVAGRT